MPRLFLTSSQAHKLCSRDALLLHVDVIADDRADDAAGDAADDCALDLVAARCGTEHRAGSRADRGVAPGVLLHDDPPLAAGADVDVTARGGGRTAAAGR